MAMSGGAIAGIVIGGVVIVGGGIGYAIYTKKPAAPPPAPRQTSALPQTAPQQQSNGNLDTSLETAGIALAARTVHRRTAKHQRHVRLARR